MTLTKVKFSSTSFFLVKFLYAIFYNMFSDKHGVIGAHGKQPINSAHKHKDVLAFIGLQRLGVFGPRWSDFKLICSEATFLPSRQNAVQWRSSEGSSATAYSIASQGPTTLVQGHSHSLPLYFSFIQLGIQQYNLDWSLQTIPLAYWATAPAFKF